MTDSLQTPAPIQLRAELDKLVRQDLFGLAGEPTEEVEESSVHGRPLPPTG
jgi:hypothetical protein